jgi:hypothetical protein
MKKIILSGLMVVLLSSTGQAHLRLQGIYVRLSQQSFYCAMISTVTCAIVSTRDWGDYEEQSGWRVTAYNPQGQVVEEFDAKSYTVTEDGGGTRFDYLP